MCRRLPLFNVLFMFVCWTCVHYLDTRLHHTFISDNYTDCFYYTLINPFYYITLCVELPFMLHAESRHVTCGGSPRLNLLSWLKSVRVFVYFPLAHDFWIILVGNCNTDWAMASQFSEFSCVCFGVKLIGSST